MTGAGESASDEAGMSSRLTAGLRALADSGFAVPAAEVVADRESAERPLPPLTSHTSGTSRREPTAEGLAMADRILVAAGAGSGVPERHTGTMSDSSDATAGSDGTESSAGTEGTAGTAGSDGATDGDTPTSGASAGGSEGTAATTGDGGEQDGDSGCGSRQTPQPGAGALALLGLFGLRRRRPRADPRLRRSRARATASAGLPRAPRGERSLAAQVRQERARGVCVVRGLRAWLCADRVPPVRRRAASPVLV